MKGGNLNLLLEEVYQAVKESQESQGSLALLVVQVWLGQKETQVHEVCLDRMVALGCQALQGFLLRVTKAALERGVLPEWAVG